MSLRLKIAWTALALLVAVSAAMWWRGRKPPLPEGIVWGNGRLEATEVDLATKYGGRLVEVSVREGDAVAKGEVVARLDDAEARARLRGAEAEVASAQKALRRAESMVEKSLAELHLAERDLGRIEKLVSKGVTPVDVLDRARTREKTARDTYSAALSAVDRARAELGAARARVDYMEAVLEDAILEAPCDCVVLYRLAEPGEVVPPGGRVLTLLDRNSMYMTIFLSQRDAGRLRLGAEARIVLDALPELPLPAEVTFVSPRAQFTPKEVETKEERARLVFRVKVALRARVDERLKAGMPGVAYIRVRKDAPWPQGTR